MKTITIKGYEINELSEQAFENAYNDYLSYGDYPWDSENRAVLDEFENEFPVKIINYEYGGYGHDFIEWKFTDNDDISELSGIRLMKYLYNNYFHILYKGKYYFLWKTGNTKHRHSKVIFEENILTGYCVGYDILKPIFSFLKKPDNSITFEELINDCLNAWLFSCSQDIEYNYSKENFRELAQANEFLFNEKGGRI